MELKRRRPRRRPSADDPVLPLINIVFLLLIFFMVAGQLSASDPFKVTPPLSAMDPSSADEAPLVLLGADGALALDGVEIAQPALIDQLRARAEAAAAPLGVRLKADHRAEAMAAARLIAAMKQAGVEKVRLLTRAGEGQ